MKGHARLPRIPGIGADKVVKSVADVSKTVIAVGTMAQVTGTVTTQLAGMFK